MKFRLSWASENPEGHEALRVEAEVWPGVEIEDAGGWPEEL